MKKIFNYKDFMKNLNESVLGSKFANLSLVNKIDYTLLKPEATEDQIIELCEKADILGVKSVCVLPKMVKVAAEALKDSDVLVCTVVSFPEGTDTPEQKLAECKQVIADGADEVDMVMNYQLLKSVENPYNLSYSKNEDFDNDEYEEEGYEEEIEPDSRTIYNNVIDDLVVEINDLTRECHYNSGKNKNGEKIILKVIVESGLLDEDQTKVSTEICITAGADFIKTSTGMVAVGAELDKVQIMRNRINNSRSNLKIKASGGIRTMADLQKFAPLVDRFGVGFAAVDSIFSDGEKPAGDAY